MQRGIVRCRFAEGMDVASSEMHLIDIISSTLLESFGVYSTLVMAVDVGSGLRLTNQRGTLVYVKLIANATGVRI